MKAELHKTGVIRISATNELESYALERWVNENSSESGVVSSINVIFDWSDKEYNGEYKIRINWNDKIDEI